METKQANKKQKPISNFYWLQMRDKVKTGLTKHLIMLMKRHQKGIYKISPIYTLVIK